MGDPYLDLIDPYLDTLYTYCRDVCHGMDDGKKAPAFREVLRDAVTNSKYESLANRIRPILEAANLGSDIDRNRTERPTSNGGPGPPPQRWKILN